MVQTRSYKIQEIICANKKTKMHDKIDEPDVYEVVSNSDVRRFVKIKMNNFKCLLEREKQVISKFSVRDLYSSEKLKRERSTG